MPTKSLGGHDSIQKVLYADEVKSRTQGDEFRNPYGLLNKQAYAENLYRDKTATLASFGAAKAVVRVGPNDLLAPDPG